MSGFITLNTTHSDILSGGDPVSKESVSKESVSKDQSSNDALLRQACYKPLFASEGDLEKVLKHSNAKTCHKVQYVTPQFQKELPALFRKLKPIQHNAALKETKRILRHIERTLSGSALPPLHKQSITVLGASEDLYGIFYAKQHWPTKGFLPNLLLLATKTWSTAKNLDFIKCSVASDKSKSFRNQYKPVPMIMISRDTDSLQDVYRKKLNKVRVSHCEVKWTSDLSKSTHRWIKMSTGEASTNPTNPSKTSFTIYYYVQNEYML